VACRCLPWIVNVAPAAARKGNRGACICMCETLSTTRCHLRQPLQGWKLAQKLWQHAGVTCTVVCIPSHGHVAMQMQSAAVKVPRSCLMRLLLLVAGHRGDERLPQRARSNSIDYTTPCQLSDTAVAMT
jgi:hypothetical protein